MTLPTVVNSHQFIPNHAITATGTTLGTNRRILRTFKNFLTDSSLAWVDNTNTPTTPANMWTVRYSCDSVTAGVADDGVDRWDSDTDLVWANAGVAHSWIVLVNAAMGSQLLISCEGAASQGQFLTLAFSANAGFSGGTTTARPTAADERIPWAGATWGGITTVDASVKLHAIKSTDGECWRLLCSNGGADNTVIIIEKAAALTSAWTYRTVCYAQGAGAATNVATNALLNTNANFYGWGTAAMALFLAGMSSGSTQTNVSQTTANSLSSEWQAYPQMLESRTLGQVGVHGHLNDIWYSSTTVATGSTAPTTGTQHQFTTAGSLVLPWCRVARSMS
jgi:hypothetical protein